MWTFIQQMGKRASQPGTTRGRKQRRSKRSASPGRSYALGVEPLEVRRLLAIDLGNITADAGMRVLSDQEIQVDLTGGVGQSDFEFQLDQSALVIAALSDLRKEALISLRVFATLELFEIDEAGNDVFLASEFFFGGDGDEIRLSLPPGRYHASIIGGNVGSFDLALHADTVPGEAVGIIPVPTLSASIGRELGILSTASGPVFTEYVGLRNENAEFPSVTDLFDMYFFDLVKPGQVEIELQHSLDNDAPLEVTLFRDIDQDGVFARETAEELETVSDILAAASLTRDLNAGRYGIAVTRGVGNTARGTNYRLETTYTVADGAGNTLGSAREAGTVGSFGVTFDDYLSANDPIDFYRFTTFAGGPFVFTGTLTGMAAGSNFELDFFRDLDADGRIDFNEVQTSNRTGNANEELSVPYTPPGTYFVRVRRTAGEGVYRLQFANRSNDLAGNTLATAHGPIDLRGFRAFSDRVTPTDAVDIYKVRLNRQSAFEVQLGGMAAGTNANLSLIRDSDGDGTIDAGETLASSTNAGNASERISRNLTAGTYFVRVVRVAGSPSYELRLVKDSVGEELATARILSPNGGGDLEFLGPEDDTDVYRFTLGSTRNVGLSVGSNTEPIAVRLGRDGNGNGVLDAAEVLMSTTAGVGPSNLLRMNLNAGTYFMILNPVLQDEGTNYHVTVFNETPDRAGNTLAAARLVGLFDLGLPLSDFVGDGSRDFMDDLEDIYRFTLVNGPFDFQSTVNVPRGDSSFRVAVVELIRDDNLNQQVDSGEVVETTVAGFGANGSVQGVINTVLSVQGTYYLRIVRNVGQVAYSLNLAIASQDTAGNTLNASRNLGQLGAAVITNEFVGRIDSQDFFRFSVPSTGELVAIVSGAGGAANIEVIRDVDDDGVVDPGETLANTNFFNGENDQLHGVVLPAADDNYYVRVLSDGNDTTYALDLAFSIQRPFLQPFPILATGTSFVKAVQFDRGGEGIAYHDTTVGNSGNQPGFRAGENIDVDVSTTSDTASLGRRVTGTAPGEFLEYTVFFERGTVYDFDVRASSPDPGATFHLEIDGVPLSEPVAVPDTDSDDNMHTIAVASGVPVSSGPHILRLVFDTGTGFNNDFAGSFNFIAVRPGFAGTFELSPAASSVAVDERMQMSLAWTVPSLGWRVLEHVDLRLRDGSGKLIWFRFDEAANTIALHNSATGTFATVKPLGSDVVIYSPLVNLYVKTTTVTADGPTSPTMVLTFDLKFSAQALGHWTIEAAASDDLGHVDPFAFAGVLDVV